MKIVSKPLIKVVPKPLIKTVPIVLMKAHSKTFPTQAISCIKIVFLPKIKFIIYSPSYSRY
jgi:hypothetical protein